MPRNTSTCIVDRAIRSSTTRGGVWTIAAGGEALTPLRRRLESQCSGWDWIPPSSTRPGYYDYWSLRERQGLQGDPMKWRVHLEGAAGHG